MIMTIEVVGPEQRKGTPRVTDSTLDFQMPEPEHNGFIRTLNQMGYMTSTLDPFSAAFVEFSAEDCRNDLSKPALEIGAAYGVATIAALKLGARVIANDIDSRHLKILKDRTPKIFKPNLQLLPGKFPDDLEIKPGTLGAVLVCRVLHFFTGPEIEVAAAKLFEWLKVGGKVFIVAETPYLNGWQAFTSEYENKKGGGSTWPGFVEEVKRYKPERAAFLPPSMHLLDPEVLSRTFLNAGFKIERCETFARTDFPVDLQLDGRESVGLIAVKHCEANHLCTKDTSGT